MRDDTPTPWCSEMVPAPKKSSAVWFYVDLKCLNQSIQREENHPLPTVDNTLEHLIDANSGFWQISLCPKSWLLIILSNHVGIFALTNSLWDSKGTRAFPEENVPTTEQFGWYCPLNGWSADI